MFIIANNTTKWKYALYTIICVQFYLSIIACHVTIANFIPVKRCCAFTALIVGHNVLAPLTLTPHYFLRFTEFVSPKTFYPFLAYSVKRIIFFSSFNPKIFQTKWKWLILKKSSAAYKKHSEDFILSQACSYLWE